MNQKQDRIFGIDLGTTYSSIAYVDDNNHPVILPNLENQIVTPSVVFFDDENVVVGNVAKESARAYPDQVVSFIKREMGEPDFNFEYKSRSYRPEEICSFIIRKVVQDARETMKQDISNVVITCPAYFGINEREATQRAGEIAGLNVCQIINEPTAAAITYATMKASEKKVVLVYDLGGGTFDITLIDIQPECIDVVCTGGDQNLGGKDWDDTIIDYMVKEFQKKTGITENILEDPDTNQDLQLFVEKAKITLGQRKSAVVVITHGGERVKIELTRDKFDKLTKKLLNRTVSFTKEMLGEAGKKGYKDFDQIILVGGSTRMPQVSKRLEKEFGKKPEIFEPDGAVAKGAAIFGWKLALSTDVLKKKPEERPVDQPSVEEDEEIKDLIDLVEADTDGIEPGEEAGDYFAMPMGNEAPLDVKDVASKSFGVVVTAADKKEIVFNVILKNTTVPVDVVKTFPTGTDNQRTVLLRIMENSISEQIAPVESSTEIGTAILKLPPGLTKQSPIDIHFRLSKDGRLQISAEETVNYETVDVEIKTSSVIQGDELADAIARSKDIIVE